MATTTACFTLTTSVIGHWSLVISSSSSVFYPPIYGGLGSQRGARRPMAVPLSSSFQLSRLLLGYVFLIVLIPTLTTAEPFAQSCSFTGSDYTANSTFRSNLDLLLSSLAADGFATGFFNSTIGSVPDRVYGLVLCRGDMEESDCRSCLHTAAEEVTQVCPNKRSAVVWYNYCMLRYSNRTFFSVPDDTLKRSSVNGGNVRDVTQFNQQLNQLMGGLVRYATYNKSARMFATGEANYGQSDTPKIYGLVQCTRDQSADECNTCLRWIIREMPSIAFGKVGARCLKATCNFRYELYPFYYSSSMVSVPLPTNATSPSVDLQPPTAPKPAEGKKMSTVTVLAIAISLGAVFALIAVLCFCFRRKRLREGKLHVKHTQEIPTIESLLFDLSTLRAATNNFSDLNLLGEGGFGTVYWGLLPDGKEIAVKRLLAGSGQGVEELENEVVLLAKLQHRNLVRVLGVCLEGEEKLLVYEYVPNRSLDKFLYDPTASQQLSWERRYKIVLGIARGLQYLHEDSQVKIIHRDLKPSNILLDADMNPKISDFGVARLFAVDQSHAITTRAVGTFGYMAPEYVMRGHFSNKSDVFSFGVIVLEIVTGRRNNALSDSGSSTHLLSFVWEHWISGTIQEVIDPSMSGRYQGSELTRCIQVGLLCVQEALADRPTMVSVVLMLSSHSLSLQVPSRPAFVASLFSTSNNTNVVSVTDVEPR